MGGVSLTEIAPRLLDKKAAAAYCGYGSRKFGNLVANGVMPPPIPALGDRWDRKSLDKHLDRLSNPVRNERREDEALAKL